MHCPRCGTSATTGQQFCRACGLGLEKVAELLGEELAVQSSTTDSDRALLRLRQQRFEHLARVAGLATISLVLLLFMVLVVSQIIMKGGLLIIPGTLLILLALGALLLGILQTHSKNLKAKLEERSVPHPLPAGVPDASGLPLASVSEGTTELLPSRKNAETGRING